MKKLQLLLSLLSLLLTVQALDLYFTPQASPCVRLLHSTGVIGCQSPKVSGPIYYASNQSTLSAFLDETKFSEQYVVLLPPTLFTKENVKALADSGRLIGITVLPSPRPLAFSPDSTCPNCEFGLYKDDSNLHQWNPNGNGMALESYDFPIFSLTEQDADAILQAASLNEQKGFTEFPLYGLELDAFMWAVENSETCLRRRTCDPVGGRSVWATLQQLQDSSTQKVILLSATSDASGFFHDVVVGRDAYISGVAALLGVADALSKTNFQSYEKNVAFTFFDAEAWGFSGSKRFVKDIVSFECEKPVGLGCERPFQQNLAFTKLKVDNLDAIVELGQVAGFKGVDTGVLYAHVDNPETSQSLVDTLVAVSDRTISSEKYSSPFLQPAFNETLNLKLPPSSAMAFLEAKRAIPVAVLNEFQTQYSNPFFYSNFDDANNTSPGRSDVICEAAKVAAKAAFLLANPSLPINASDSINVDCSLIDEIMLCLTQNFSCPLVTGFLSTSGTTVPTHYSGVFTFGKISTIPAFIHQFLANTTATERAGECPCDTSEKPYTCVASTCIISNVQYHDAYPVGIDYDYKQAKFFVADLSLPTWTESQWKYTRARLYLGEALAPQIGTLVVGILITLIALVGTFFVKKFLQKTLKVD